MPTFKQAQNSRPQGGLKGFAAVSAGGRRRRQAAVRYGVTHTPRVAPTLGVVISVSVPNPAMPYCDFSNEAYL